MIDLFGLSETTGWGVHDFETTRCYKYLLSDDSRPITRISRCSQNRAFIILTRRGFLLVYSPPQIYIEIGKKFECRNSECSNETAEVQHKSSSFESI